MRALLLIVAAAVLVACSNGAKDEGKSAKEVMKDYTGTLAGAPEKARKAVEKTGERNTETDKALKELDK
jgi:hypothetical protein